MAHAYYHARSAARRFGGVAEDYLALEQWMDHTKAHLADARHRLVLHNSWGIFIAEQLFGVTITHVSDGKRVPTRTVLEQHVLEDLQRSPERLIHLKLSSRGIAAVLEPSRCIISSHRQ
jgi:hypothetical protein